MLKHGAMLLVSIACLSLMAENSAFSAQQGVPAKDCPTAATPVTPTVLSALGHSTTSASKAEERADQACKSKLATSGGFVCTICTGNGEQCSRSVILPRGGAITHTPAQWNPAKGRYESTATYTPPAGTPQITCACGECDNN